MKAYFNSLTTVLLAWLAPVHGLLLLIIASVLLDTVFGIWASIKLKKPIVSRKLERLVIKIGLYCGSFLLLYGVDVLIINHILQSKLGIELLLSKIIALLFILLEGFSIDEKIRSVYGKGIGDFLEKVLAKAVTAKRNVTKLIEKK